MTDFRELGLQIRQVDNAYMLWIGEYKIPLTGYRISSSGTGVDIDLSIHCDDSRVPFGEEKKYVSIYKWDMPKVPF